MRHFVSAQVYAFRNQSVRSARPSDHRGSPGRRAPRARFPPPRAALTGSVLDRLPAIRDSATETLPTPGCGPMGFEPEHLVRKRSDGARLPSRGGRSARGRRRRSRSSVRRLGRRRNGLGDHGPGAGRGRGSIGWAAAVPTTFTSSSRRARSPRARQGLHADPHGHAPGGAFATAQVYYQDTSTGIVTITASGPGVTAGTRSVAVTGAAPVSIRLEPPTATVTTGGTATFDVIGLDQLGNEFPVVATDADPGHARHGDPGRADRHVHRRRAPAPGS